MIITAWAGHINSPAVICCNSFTGTSGVHSEYWDWYSWNIEDRERHLTTLIGCANKFSISLLQAGTIGRTHREGIIVRCCCCTVLVLCKVCSIMSGGKQYTVLSVKGNWFALKDANNKLCCCVEMPAGTGLYATNVISTRNL